MKAILLLTLLLVALVYSRTTWDKLHNYSFDQYKQEFGKKYSSPQEEEMRKDLFEKKLLKIKKHNADTTKTWKEGVNKFTDRTPEEFKKVNGYKKRFWASSPNRSTGYNVEQLKTEKIQLPDSFDWRTKNVLSAVKDQGECGSCWTFAATESIESAYAIKYGAGFVTDLSEQQVLDCTPNPDECGGTGGCNGGTCELVYQNMIKMGGITTEWYYPYISYYGSNYNCHFNSSITVPYAQLSNYTKLPSNQYDPLINALVQNGPIAITVMASTWSDYESGVYAGCPNTNIDLDHAVLLVGYGTDAATGADYWLIRNSWSPKWGEDGYIRLRRDFGTKLTCGIDYNPSDGTGCKNGPKQVTACGMCGVLYDTSFPIIA